ncbi:MAG: HRDC domain-containing protein, partial [Candidatus Sumerlaeota bacterium]|nr:HRDC domain-containing protein [Candidatus Sumerlaeota bacterium]
PDPAVAERADRLRKARNALARDMGLDPGVLASNASLVAIAAAAPQTLRELEAAAGLMPWQAQAAGERFLAVLAAPDQPSPSPAPEDESGGGP